MKLRRKKVSVKSLKKKLYAAFGLILFALLYIQRGEIYKLTSVPVPSENSSIDFTNVYVKKVYDGDTFLASNSFKVRLIGVDTPESYESNKLSRDSFISGIKPAQIIKLGKISHAFTKKMCEHKYVRIEFDSQKKDRYGRILAYVFLPDGKLLNEEILRSGYGLVYLKFPFKDEYRYRFIIAQEYAKSTGAGLWRETPGLRELEKTSRS